MSRKIDLMYEMFGRGDGKCGTCSHFVKFTYRDSSYQKCEVYGVSQSEATDWVQKWDGCGLYNKPYEGDIPVYKLNGKASNGDGQIDGQMSLFG